MKWKILKLTNESAIATTHDYWGGTNNLIVHIDRKDDRLEIHSRLLPFKMVSAPDIFFSNKMTKSTFISIYKESARVNDIVDVIEKQEKDKEDKIENGKEWNFKSILKRIIAYSFCTGFIGLAYFALTEEFYILGVILGLIGSSYIILDIYIIVKKKMASS